MPSQPTASSAFADAAPYTKSPISHPGIHSGRGARHIAELTRCPDREQRQLRTPAKARRGATAGPVSAIRATESPLPSRHRLPNRPPSSSVAQSHSAQSHSAQSDSAQDRGGRSRRTCSRPTVSASVRIVPDALPATVRADGHSTARGPLVRSRHLPCVHCQSLPTWVSNGSAVAGGERASPRHWLQSHRRRLFALPAGSRTIAT